MVFLIDALFIFPKQKIKKKLKNENYKKKKKPIKKDYEVDLRKKKGSTSIPSWNFQIDNADYSSAHHRSMNK